MATPPRSTEQRIADTLAKLTTEVDCWVPSASAGGEIYLIPLSFVWHDERLTLATPAASRTARNLRRAGQARIALGGTRDVVIVEGTLTFIPKEEVAPALADAFVKAASFDPRSASGEYLYITLTPRLVQAWRNVGELAGREIMRDGQWRG
jgi:nitroimidazol reductase NimA-like FMN-containing flavoprotein (pyridoxamine 5'-phosphate oxidase superfamily)